jgi:hypothetical protein
MGNTVDNWSWGGFYPFNTTQILGGAGSIVFGPGAGRTNILGNNAGLFNSIAIGHSAAFTRLGASSVALGMNAGLNGQDYSVAIGHQAGQSTSGPIASIATQGTISIGWLAHFGNIAGSNTIAIGSNAALNGSRDNGIVIGHNAGYTNSGFVNPNGSNVVIIGHKIPLQSNSNVITIGTSAAVSNVASSSVILNGTGTGIGNTTTAGVYVAPVRLETSTLTLQPMMYNPTTKEVVYSTTVATPTVQGYTPISATTYGAAPADFDARKMFVILAGAVGPTTIQIGAASLSTVGSYVDIFNLSASSVIVAPQAGSSLFLAGSSAASSSRTLATKGHGRLWYVAGSTYMIEGTGWT